MDPATVIALLAFLNGGIGTVVRWADRARADGEITPAQFDAVMAAARPSDAAVDSIIAAAKARQGVKV